MADPGIEVFSRAILFAVLFLHVFSNPVNIPLQSVSDLLIQSALNSLNEDSPTRHTYKGGNLISAQKLLEPPYVIYRLTLNLEPECDGDSSSCPREACAINLKQHELGVIEVQQSSIQCMYLYPQVQEDEVNRVQQTQQESSLDMNLQDQDVIESLDKQILNQSVELDHEVQTAADQNDEPFIAVRASNLKYCPGCPYELNPTLPGLSAFAEQAVQSMDEAGQTEYKHKLVSIVRVTRAVPPGSNVVQYNLLLDIGESNCLNSTPIDRSECSLQSNIPIRLCQVTFEERPWQENSRQITKNNCTEGQGVENELSSSRSPNIAADSLVSSRLNNQQSVQEVLVKTSNYDQLTQERKTATYGSLIDELFGNPVNATVVEIATEQTGTPVTEETLTKIVLNNDNEKEEAVFFNDKFKEFDEFLEDFNVSIKTEVSIPSSTGVPVTEEVIVAVKVNEENITTEASSKDNKETQVTNLNTYELNNSSSESNSSEEVQTSEIVQVKDSSEESQESAESKELPVALKRKKRALSSKLPQSEINFINALAKKAVDILDDIDIDNGKRIIVAVENATTIYSHGIIYRITMLIANTSCDENSRHELNCKNKTIPPRKRCKIEVHLDGKRLLHTAKVAKSSCCDLPEEVNNHVTRRRRGISGGVNAISVSDPEVLKYASMGLETFSTNFEGPNEPILVEIQEASVQVVSGNLYKIKVKLGTSNCPKGTKNNCALKPDSETKICLIKVWSQPWLDEGSPDVKVNCDQTRRKRGISGGVNSISVSDPEVLKYASMGLETFSTNFEGPNEPILVEIQEASVQVVSGNLYKIKVKLGTSNCPKGTKNNCALKPDSETKICLIKVWSQPWLDEGSPDVKVTCDQTKKKRGIPGGVNAISVSDPEVLKYASMGLETFSTNFEGPNEPILVEIQEASVQVVSGNLYKIKVKLGTSNCPKGTKNNCALKPDSETKICVIKVWSQPWLDEGSPDVKVNCDQTRRKRGISGGVNSISVSDPEVLKYASMGLETFSTNFEGPNEPILVEIQEASVQVVSGNLYKIKVKLGTSNCPKGTKNNCALKPDSETKICLIKVWSQPWLDEGSPDVKVTCDQTKKKRGIPGGVNAISVSDPEVLKYASMGLETFSTNFEGPNEPILVEIQEASVQVVSGNLYKIKVKLGTSNCPKGTKNNCALKPDSETKICLIKVWSQPWLDEGSPDVKVNCDQTRRKRGISGGVNSISVSDPEVLKYASMGLETFSTNFEGPNEPILVEIQEASVQVVSGNLYKIKVKLGTSNCPKGTKNNCALKPDSETKICLIKVWSQPWLDEGSPDVKVTCDQTKKKRGIPGGVNAISVSDPEVLKYASMGLQKFSANSEGPNEPILVEIQEASVQVVSGYLYKIKVKLGTSNCPKGTKNNCALKPDSETKICLIKVWSQPWLDEGSPDVKVTCDQTKKKRGIPGGVNAISVSDPEVLKYASMGLQKFSANSEGPNEPILVEIQEASVQVVSGYLYKIKVKLGTSNCPKGTKNNCALKPDSETKICLIKVWSQPWLDKGSPDVKVTCDQTRKKRGTPGGVNAISVSDPEVLKYASMGLETFSANFESPNEPILVEIQEASVQVVSGNLYKIKVKLGTSNCPKGTKNNCALKPDSETKICLIKVWSQPWLDKGSPDVKVTCDQTRKKRGTPGGVNAISVSDPEVLKYASMGLETFSANFESPNEPILVEIQEASVQVVSGNLYKIKVKLGTSNCPKGTKNNCALKPDSETKICLIKVWSRPWLDKGSPDVKVTCDQTRKKRGTPGGVNAISVSDPEVLKYASMGLETFSANFESPNEPILVEIQEASVQVVSGNLYKIKVKLGTSNCPKGTKNNCALKPDSETKICLIKVWSQPWLDKGSPDVKVTCDQTRKKRGTPGGVNAISVSDPEVLKYASMGLETFSANFESPNEPILVEIQEASVQVVSGNLYKIKVKLGTSNCPKGTKNNCALKPDSETKICLIKVWSRPWLDKGSPDIKVNCDQTPRRKRSLRGVNYSLKMMNQAKYLKYEKMFQQFTQDFNKTYSSSKERKDRFKIFKKNLNVIEELQKNEQGTAKYGITMFADLSKREFKKKYLGLRPDLKLENHIPMPMAEIPDNVELPTEFDWRDRHVVTEVKDQGQCGSCWAFSVTGNIESLYAIKYKNLLSLSEQELVDCDTFDQGCGGGLPDNAYRAIENLGGLELEKDYPYEAENEKCHFNKSKAKVVITSAVNITSNETLMAKWLVSNGPISIGINANAMQFYMGGVSHPYKFLCSPDNLDHGVLIVGYGIHTYPLFNKKLPYWTIKNSWGPRWGEQGYYRVYRGDGTCGVNQMASSAIVA